jgi:hypothetical protein
VEISGWLSRGDEPDARDDKMGSLVCFCIAKLSTDPSGLSLITNEVAMADEQLVHLQTVPLAR